MQVGVSQLIVPGISIADFFARAAAAGYEVVEIAMRATGELSPQTGEQDLRRIRATADRAGVRLVSMCMLHLTGNPLDSGDAQRTAIGELSAGLRAAAAMGIPCTLTTLGRLRPDLYYDDAYRNGVRALKDLAPLAEQLGVAVAYEFVWNGFLFSPLEMKRFLDEVASPQIGFYFDPGNMAVFQYPHHWARLLGPYIKMVHMKDWKGSALNGGWPALLRGDIDYAAINRELRAAGYDGPMISEVPPDVATLEETAASIRRIIQM